jgi:3-oxoacyl-[acyl-carrier protein] reductase
MEGRVALVTGAGRGIGRAIAIRLAREDAKVAILYRSNDTAAGETAELAQGAGGECKTFKGNIASPEDVEALVNDVSEAFGPVEILVNNAGIRQDNILLRMKDAEFDEVLDTNLKGAYLCTRAFLRGMVRARWGRIVNISSVVGLIGNAGQANYAASKAGLIGFTKSVAREVANRGITANAVAPGFVQTELTEELPGNIKEQILGQIPTGRFGEAEEIAEVVSFLASDTAAYITGQTITVDGGMVMH